MSAHLPGAGYTSMLYRKDAHIHRWPWTESTTVASRYDRVSPPNTLRLSVYQRSKVDQRAIIAAHTVISIRRISERCQWPGLTDADPPL